MSRAVNSEAWRERAPSQANRILGDLRGNYGGWFCALEWNRSGILRYGARIWELRHDAGHEIEERICAEHKVAEYRLVYDADWDKEPE